MLKNIYAGLKVFMIFLFLIPLVSAPDFGYDNPNLPNVPSPEVTNPAIYCESSDLTDQNFAVAGNRYRINITNIDEGNGIGMSTGNNGTNISIETSGVYHMVAQPQVKAGAGSAGDFHMWMEKHNTTQWVDIPDSNIELKLSSLEEDVIVLATTLKLNAGEKLRLVVSVSDDGIILHAQSPAGEPIIPSIIFTMYRVGS